MQKKYGFKWDPDSVTRFDHLVEGVEDSIQSMYNILNWVWFDRRTQKVNVSIDKYDTWSMDHTLAHIVLPMLVQLKATNHGYPANLTEKKWDSIMSEMIWAFGQKCADDWELNDDHAARQERMTNGFKLFGEYYENLWD
tara:strand:- start:168 stop:584 length:417 start_codon:yes stop_codon:yes gene_type:complete